MSKTLFYFIKFALLISILSVPFETQNKTYLHRFETVKFRPTLSNELSDMAPFEPLDSTFNKFLNDWKLVGATVAVMKEGKLIYAKGFGKPKLTTQFRLQPYHQFRLASVSKLVTATAILKLVDEGKLSLNDKIFGENGILDSEIYKPVDKRAYSITVNHLLRHLGGWSLLTMGDPMFKPLYIAEQLKTSPPPSFEDIASLVLSYKLAYTPGTTYEYSNFGYCLLDRVIEQVTDMKYEDYVRYKILIPNGILEMKIGGNLLEERGANEVIHYDFSKNNTKVAMDGSKELVPSTYGGTDIKTLGGAGGWVASPIELLKFISLVDGHADQPDIVKKDLILKMVDVNVPGRSPIGWRQVQDEWTWTRTGTMAGTSALVVRQQDGITWTVISNTSNWRSNQFNTYVKRMMSGVLPKIEEWPERNLFELM